MIKEKGEIFILIISSFFIVNVSYAQYNPNPCSTKGVFCDKIIDKSGVIYSFEGDTIDYPAVGTSMPFWLAVGDTLLRTIDTSFQSTVFATVLSGPGLLQGSISQNISKYTYFNDWKFSKSGNYKIEFMITTLNVKDTVVFRVTNPVDLCSKVPEGCTYGGGNLVFPSTGNGGIIPVDAIFPISVGVINRATGQLDSSFFGYVYLDQLSGPGVMYGTRSMYGGRWLTFTDIRFDKVGRYSIRVSTNAGYLPDTFNVNVVDKSNNHIVDLKMFSTIIFPNPFTDKITIEEKTGEEIRAIRLLNTQGRVIDQYLNLKSHTINLAHLPEGVYFFEVQFKMNLKKHVSIVIKK